MNGDTSREVEILNKVSGRVDIPRERRREEILDSDAEVSDHVGCRHGAKLSPYFTTPPLVHKDIRSSNVLDGDMRVKIASLGLTRSAETEEGEFDMTRHIVGTKGYLAPEYLENGLISVKGVYAFGVLLLETISGKEVVSIFAEARIGSLLTWFTL